MSVASADRAAQLKSQAKDAGSRLRRAVNRGAGKLAQRTGGVAASSAPIHRLSAAEALSENGFTVFRKAFSDAEVASLAASMKAEAGITEGERYTSIDAINRFSATRDVLFDDRVLYAVRTALGAQGRFLQVSDLHYRSDTIRWHRDSVHRAADSSDAPDWAALDGEDYGVVKAILYMEADNAAMGFICGSHLSPQEIDRKHVQQLEDAGQYTVVGPHDEPNQRFTDAQKALPFAWKAEPGDLLVFDQRLYHGGRRVSDGKVTDSRSAPKFTLSMVFGADNQHSYRMYSYFRYARADLAFRDFGDSLRERLEQHDLVLSAGWSNYYETSPEDLRLVYLRKPETLEPLIEQFSAAGAGNA